MVLLVSRPVKQAFSKELVGFGSPEGTWKYYSAFAKHGFSLVLCRVFSVFYQVKPLQAMGFEMEHDTAEQMRRSLGLGSASSSGEAPAPIYPRISPKSDEADDYCIAETAWKFALALARHRAMSMQSYQQLPPGCSILLLVTSATTVKAALKHHGFLWKAIEVAEQKQFEYPYVKEVFLHIPLLYNEVLREMLVHLAQHSFMIVPPTMRSVVETVFRGFASSVVVERAFQRCVDHGRNSDNKIMGRATRYSVPRERALLQEHGRNEIQVDSSELPQHSSRSVPRSAYNARWVASPASMTMR